MRSSVGGYVKSVRVEDVSTSGEGGCRGVGSLFGVVGVVIGEEGLNSWRIVVCAVCCLFSGFEGRKRFLGCRGSGFCRNMGFDSKGVEREKGCCRRHRHRHRLDDLGLEVQG